MSCGAGFLASGSFTTCRWGLFWPCEDMAHENIDSRSEKRIDFLVPFSPFNHAVYARGTLNKLLHFPVSQFPHLQRRNDNGRNLARCLGKLGE